MYGRCVASKRGNFITDLQLCTLRYLMERTGGFGRDRAEYMHNERVLFNSSSISEAESMDLVSNSSLSRRGKARASRIEHFNGYNSYSQGSHSRASYRPEYASSEGPPSYHGSGHGRFGMYSYHENVRYTNHGLESFENLENNRVELLRKLDELEDQLSRSCDMTDTPLAPDDVASRYARQGPGFSPLTNRHDPYSQRGNQDQSVSYGDTYEQEIQDCFCEHCRNETSCYGSYNQDDGFNHNRRIVETHRGKIWLPIAGGAPIVACFNCFEVLKLPRKHLLPLSKTQHKLKCGACSSIILLQLGNRDSGHDDQVSTDALCNDYGDEKKLVSDDSENTETLASGKHASPSVEDRCSANIVMEGFEKGNKSKRFDLDNDQNTPSQNYVEDSVVATEITLNSGVSQSQDSLDQSGDTNSSFTESRPYSEIAASQVFVNGQLIPDRLVQKAEKLAGPIQHGDYWYDVHAGFWGVMGFPCLGIIMPNIEEFNYPMPENCGAGNTGVFVNGRELNQKDLSVLAGRGLPEVNNGSYLVQISGKVFDEHTGEELHSLGKLAPTVERAKRGFGMKVPGFIARSQRR